MRTASLTHLIPVSSLKLTKERAYLLSPFSIRPRPKSAPGEDCIYDSPIPASSLKLTKERACLLCPFSTNPRPRPAPIRAPTCRTEGMDIPFVKAAFSNYWMQYIAQKL